MSSDAKLNQIEEKAHHIERCRTYRQRLLEMVDRSLLPDDQRRYLELLISRDPYEPHGRLCDGLTHMHAIAMFCKMAATHWPKTEMKGARSYYVIFTDDARMTSLEDEHLRINAFRMRIGRTVRSMGLSAVGFIEIQAVSEESENQIKLRLVGHAHAWGPVDADHLLETSESLHSAARWASAFAFPDGIRTIEGGSEEVASIMWKHANLPFDLRRFPSRPVGAQLPVELSRPPERLSDAQLLSVAKILKDFASCDLMFGFQGGQAVRLRVSDYVGTRYHGCERSLDLIFREFNWREPLQAWDSVMRQIRPVETNRG